MKAVLTLVLLVASVAVITGCHAEAGAGTDRHGAAVDVGTK